MLIFSYILSIINGIAKIWNSQQNTDCSWIRDVDNIQDCNAFEEIVVEIYEKYLVFLEYSSMVLHCLMNGTSDNKYNQWDLLLYEKKMEYHVAL